jgi:hypothetical protein
MLRYLVSLFWITLATAACAQQISTPAQLIAEMQTRYATKWYHTLSFEQQSITHHADGTTSTELWHEALWLPGRLRVDIGDRSAGNGMLFVNNHLYVFRDGKLASDRDYLHPLLILGFDVYLQPADTTLAELKDLKFDLSSIHQEDFDGRPTYVVGAKSGDLKTPQFWIDKERLYFVRLIEPSPKQPTTTQDIRFEDYKQAEGGGWLSEHVTIHNDGKLVFEERYSDIKINPPLKEELFDPQKFVQPAGGTAK